MNWDYIAGFFDGEGTITIAFRKNKTSGFGYHIHAFWQVSQKDRKILDDIGEFTGKAFRVTWTQRAHKFHTESYEGLQTVCDNLKGRVHVKEKQLVLLAEYLELIKDYHYRSFSKEMALAILRIAKQISQCSIKPNLAYQRKLDVIKEEIEKNPWSPEVRYAKMSQTRKKNWEDIYAGRKEMPNFHPQRLYDPFLHIVREHPDQLRQTLEEAKRKLTYSTYLRFRKLAQNLTMLQS